MKLTIAIPTYNNSDRFHETLKSIIPQIKGKDIEILIRDDSDGTEPEVYGEQG